MFFLTTAPLWLAGLVLVGLTTLIAMMGPPLIRRRMSLDVLRTNNEVAGFKFASVGVIYAVLLGLAVIVVWEKFNDAENNIALEAGAAARFCTNSTSLPRPGAPGSWCPRDSSPGSSGRCCSAALYHHRLYVLLRHEQSACANPDDGSSDGADFFGAARHYRHRPSIFRNGQG